jgi:succinoglycan biosynthesis protein ExoO
VIGPDISVIVTSYNVEGYIARAVESALLQQGVSLEVIVVDDCSSDGTRNVLATIADPRLRVIGLTENAGPSGARNRAIEAARGMWLAVLDGDDSYASGRLAALLALANQTNADMVVDNLTILREADGAMEPMFDYAELSSMPRLSAEQFIAGNQSFTSGYGLGYLKPMFRAEFLKAHGLRYRESIRIGEDYLLMLEVLASGAHCSVLPSEGYLYTVRKGSISHRLTKEDVDRIRMEDARIFDRYRFSEGAMRQQASRIQHLHEAYHYNELVEAIKAGQGGKALGIILRHPAAACHLWLPIRKRLGRAMGIASY